jgi:hypothetical protein
MYPVQLFQLISVVHTGLVYSLKFYVTINLTISAVFTQFSDNITLSFHSFTSFGLFFVVVVVIM